MELSSELIELEPAKRSRFARLARMLQTIVLLPAVLAAFLARALHSGK